MSSLSSTDQETLPIVINVCNFPPPTETAPSLLSSGNVKTLFHELGHAMHGLLSSVRYPSLTGTNVVRDYVEFPSQLLENWGRAPEVVRQFARHYQSDETISDALLSKLASATNFNQGFTTTEYLAASYLDLAWHMQEGPSKTADEIEHEVAERIGLPPEIGFRYRSRISLTSSRGGIPHIIIAIFGQRYWRRMHFLYSKNEDCLTQKQQPSC